MRLSANRALPLAALRRLLRRLFSFANGQVKAAHFSDTNPPSLSSVAIQCRFSAPGRYGGLLAAQCLLNQGDTRGPTITPPWPPRCPRSISPLLTLQAWRRAELTSDVRRAAMGLVR